MPLFADCYAEFQLILEHTTGQKPATQILCSFMHIQKLLQCKPLVLVLFINIEIFINSC